MTWQRLLDTLAATNSLDPRWRPHLVAVPRTSFVPDRALVSDGVGKLLPIDRHQDRAGWEAAVHSDRWIVTQMDDGAVPAGQSGRIATSSSSMPSMVALMLSVCEISDGHRVLEIGTGTGWNAALLAHRLGPKQVVTVEIDTRISEQARKALAEVGLHPRVVAADGELGWQPGAPYDRVLATCAVRRIPRAWVAQTRPAGRIVTPYRDLFSHHGKLLTLTVAADGASAAGRFADWASFMMSRPQRQPEQEVPTVDGVERTTDLHPGFPFAEEAELPIGAKMGSCQWWRENRPNGRFESRLDDVDGGSWATVGPLGEASAAPYPVRQGGPRRLWDEVETAYRWWESVGRPGYDRFGLTVTPDRQWVWLDHPDRPVSGAVG